MKEITGTNTRNALIEGLEGTKRQCPVLENTKVALNESATAGATQAGNIATLNKVIPASNNVMSTVIANEIIGVQSMDLQVRSTLRVRYAESKAGVFAGDEAYQIRNCKRLLR